MKWSQGLCASILVDGLCYAPEVRSNPRPDQDFPGVPADPASTPNALAVGFRGPPKSRPDPASRCCQIWHHEAPPPLWLYDRILASRRLCRGDPGSVRRRADGRHLRTVSGLFSDRLGGDAI
jgi:hypothetical protein